MCIIGRYFQDLDQNRTYLSDDFFSFFFLFFFFFLSFRNDMRTALATGDYQTLLEFLTTTFDSFSEMNEVFKVRFNEASEL